MSTEEWPETFFDDSEPPDSGDPDFKAARILAREKLVFALDIDLPEPALECARALRGDLSWIKVGSRLHLRGGRPLIEELRGMGYQVFLDLKFHDIPAQVEGSCNAAARIGAQMMTIHASGGPEMIKAAVRGAKDGAESAGLPMPRVLAVTVLTSLDDGDLRFIGVDSSVKPQVLRLARLSHSLGAGGIVASPKELHLLRSECPAPFAILTPGIRPRGADVGDQKRVMTPHDAIRGGADFIVVGRPIRKAKDPILAARAILDEIAQALIPESPAP